MTTTNVTENNDNTMVLMDGYSEENISNNDNDNVIGTLDDNETDDNDTVNNTLPSFEYNNGNGNGNDNDDSDDSDDDSDDDSKDPYMDEWQCPQCTLIQHISYRICDACGYLAPKLSPWQENMITEWE
eukprot:927441_1